VAVDLERASALIETDRGDAERSEVDPTAGGDEEAFGAELVAVGEVDGDAAAVPAPPLAEVRSAAAPVRTSMPSLRRTAAITSPASGSSRGSRRFSASTTVTRTPKRA